MIVELGHFALVLGLVLVLVQSVVPIWGAHTRDERLMSVAAPVAGVQFLMVGLAFAALTMAYIQSDFSVLNVCQNSHSDKPLIYRISGVWGNHEGSMLLWVLILSLFGALVAAFGRTMPETLKANVLGVQGWISVAFLAFILFTSNPFIRIPNPPMEGQDLNPILQDVGLAIHPPLLYLGYVGFSITFSFAAAALLDGRIDAAWARWVRPWILIAWIFLTLGIAMGSYWAYYELGWGGYWFWDPVENASFMPWLAGTALLHSALVMEKRDALKVWTVLLAILTFSLSLLGTFLVRSGVLISVHAFATDPSRGVFILAILAIFIGGSLSLYAWRAPLLKQGGLFAPISREGSLILNNLFLTAACAAVLVGTLYPLALDVTTGDKISVGAPFFNMTFGPLMIPLLIAMPFGPFLAWKRGDLLAVAQRLMMAFALAIVIALAVVWVKGATNVMVRIGIGIAVWVMTGAVSEIVWRSKLRRVPLGQSFRRAVGLPRSSWGTMVAHFGMGATMLGIVAVSAWQQEVITVMAPGETKAIGGYELTFDGLSPSSSSNYREDIGHFTLRKGGAVVADMKPAKRFYMARQMPTTESAIETFWFSQVYVSLGDPKEGGAIVVRAYYKPLVTLIWLGAVVMVLGGLLSLSDRRLRVGAPRRAHHVAAAAPAE
ncbi:heme lyase CcmF/NrfE family subunit [Breoghania sp.]|uniref:heme lyase CcmF/NrfE family subunit n=1 Tax=Breoghania sp. TaxID=2065378 RepID=UPI002605B8FD|nr:heme lyase CcmF/NrfE family subunit [Breoghania sp.]MDJ0931854.1 heme lyase CcmF/NrfE family subunit [Breoghania sp.]